MNWANYLTKNLLSMFFLICNVKKIKQLFYGKSHGKGTISDPLLNFVLKIISSY